VHDLGVGGRSQQRCGRASRHRDVQAPGQVEDLEGVGRSRIHGYVPVDDGDASDVELRRPESQQEGDGVVDPRIRVDEDVHGPPGC
jgi:hypothetical protein